MTKIIMEADKGIYYQEQGRYWIFNKITGKNIPLDTKYARHDVKSDFESGLYGTILNES